MAKPWIPDSVNPTHLCMLQFICKEADEHLPEPVKKQAAELAARVRGVWQENVVDAAWAKEAARHLAKANTELKDFITANLKRQPALAHLAVSRQYSMCAVYGTRGTVRRRWCTACGAVQ